MMSTAREPARGAQFGTERITGPAAEAREVGRQHVTRRETGAGEGTAVDCVLDGTSEPNVGKERGDTRTCSRVSFGCQLALVE
jgi:hypothetical protein